VHLDQPQGRTLISSHSYMSSCTPVIIECGFWLDLHALSEK
jgi:hypothetical protein